MLGKLFTLIIPYGSIAWRVGFMSAFFGATAAALVCLIVIRLVKNPVAGAIAGLAFAFSDEFWKQSNIAEVYTLNTFLIAACILILVVWQEARSKRLLYLFAVVYGLGLCNHHTMHFLGPVFGAFILSVQWRGWRPWKTYFAMVGVAFVVWLLIHLYLPVRAMADPAVNYGNPQTWNDFWAVVLRKRYAFGFDENPQSIARTLRQVIEVGRMFSHQFTPYLALVPLLGLYPLWKIDRRRFLFLVGLLAYIVAGFIYVLNFNFDRDSLWMNSVFFIPAYMVGAILVGTAFSFFLAKKKETKKKRFWVAMALCLAVPAVAVVANYRANDKSHYYFSHDYGMNILNTLEPNAIYFNNGDHEIYPLLYLQTVEGLRPDVTLGYKYGYPQAEFLKYLPPNFQKQDDLVLNEKAVDAIIEGVIAKSDRPVYMTSKQVLLGVPQAQIVNAGLIYQVVTPDQPAPERDYWADYTWHALDPAAARGDMTAETILAEYHLARGRDDFAQGNFEEGGEEMMAAAQIASTRKAMLHKIAWACGNYNLLDAAIMFGQMALEVDPDCPVSLRYMEIFCQAKGDYEAAKIYCERRLHMLQELHGMDNSDVATALNNLGVLLVSLDDLTAARDCFQKAYQLDLRGYGEDQPFTARDRHNLGVVLDRMGQTEAARQHMQAARTTMSQHVGEQHSFIQTMRDKKLLQME